MWVTYLVDTDETVSEPVVKTTVHAHAWSVVTASGVEIQNKDVISILDDDDIAGQIAETVDPMIAFNVMRDHAKTDRQKEVMVQVEQLMRATGKFRDE